MPNASVAPAVQDLRRRAGAIAAALVSRDGTVPYADLSSGGYAETFAIMGRRSSALWPLQRSSYTELRRSV
jgi:hypothetical protein